MGSPRQLDAGAWSFSAFYQGVQDKELNFSPASGGICTSRTGTASFPCGSSGNVEGKADGGAAVLKVAYQPYEALRYYAAFGAGDYTLSVASIAWTNVLSGDRPGQLYQAGVKAVLFPDTVAGPGLAADLGLGWQRYWFTGLQPAHAASEATVNERLDILTTHVALETGHLFKREGWRVGVEPYGGLKWVRDQAWLKDFEGGGRVGGIKDTFTPFLGVHLQVYEKEALYAEASFVNGWQYAAGLSVRFK